MCRCPLGPTGSSSAEAAGYATDPKRHLAGGRKSVLLGAELSGLGDVEVHLLDQGLD